MSRCTVVIADDRYAAYDEEKAVLAEVDAEVRVFSSSSASEARAAFADAAGRFSGDAQGDGRERFAVRDRHPLAHHPLAPGCGYLELGRPADKNCCIFGPGTCTIDPVVPQQPRGVP